MASRSRPRIALMVFALGVMGAVRGYADFEGIPQ